MSSSFSEPIDFLWAVGREGLVCSGDPRINSALFCFPTGDSISEATVADKQGMSAFYHGDEASSPLHFHPVRAETGAFTACIPSGPQPNLPTYRAQPSGVGEHVIIQDTQDGGTRNRNRKARAVCTDCNKDFGRAQELARHRKDVHEQRHLCLFCDFKWTRPSSIKAHLFAKHSEKFTVEHLVAIQALRGRMIVAFLDAYNQGSGPV
ncbi:hypothetical protein F5888DRAFT_370736 [Russula emetica]|nr:hypothetical protein F5888DRAFT_370736 [Russula emetica]